MLFRKIKNKFLHYRKTLFYCVCVVLGGITGFYAVREQPASAAASLTSRTIEVRFSPKGGCTELITRAISEATKEIYVAVYSFTSPPIAEALLAAKKKGVKVCLLYDDGEYDRGKAPQVDKLAGSIDYLKKDDCTGYAHNKLIVIDGKSVLIGSFNFDINAEEKNRENVMYIRNDRQLAKKYIDNWQKNDKRIRERKKTGKKKKKKK